MSNTGNIDSIDETPYYIYGDTKVYELWKVERDKAIKVYQTITTIAQETELKILAMIKLYLANNK